MAKYHYNSKYSEALRFGEDGQTYCAICDHRYSQPTTSGSTTTTHFRFHLSRYHPDAWKRVNEKGREKELTKTCLLNSTENSMEPSVDPLLLEIKQEDFEMLPGTSSSLNVKDLVGENFARGGQETTYGLEHKQILRLIDLVKTDGDLLYKRKNADYRRKHMKERWFIQKAELLGVSGDVVEFAYKRLIKDLSAQKRHEKMYPPENQHLVPLIFPYYNEMEFVWKTWEREKIERDLGSANSETSNEPKLKRSKLKNREVNDSAGEEIEFESRLDLSIASHNQLGTQSELLIDDEASLRDALQKTRQVTNLLFEELRNLRNPIDFKDKTEYRELIEKIESKLEGKSTLDRFSFVLKVAQFIDSI